MTIDTTAMPIYQGTKTLKAHPMTRGEYNRYRGWNAPVDEDMGERGYLVEYTDGGKPNDDRHAGYISWSPADVFDKTYRPAGTFQDRVRIEEAELSEKAEKLATFLLDGKSHALPLAEREALTEQLEHMTSYWEVLRRRIAAFDEPNGQVEDDHGDYLF